MFDLGSQDYAGESQFSQLNAGVNIPAKLVGVAVDDESGDLIFSFKGTDNGDVAAGIKPNNGTLNHRVWANNFDPTNDYYDETWAKRYINQTKHILKAFLDVAVVEGIKGATWLEFASSILDVMPEASWKDVPVLIKVLLDNKNRPQLPVFPDFISSPKMPKTLRLDTRINNNTGMPFERITPIELDETPAASTEVGGFDDINASTETEAPAPAAAPEAAQGGAAEPAKPAFT